MTISQGSTDNILLGAMTADDYALLQPHLTRVPLELGQVIVTAREPIGEVHFIEGSGVASIVADVAGQGVCEVGLVGREGLSGVAAILGAESTPHRTFMQVAGCASLRIESGALLDAVDRSPSMRLLLSRYVHTVVTQFARSAVSNVQDRMETRLARWLLMCCDRVREDEIHLTHEFMSTMIGAHRSGVTVTLHILEGMGAIRSKRGRVIIRDRGMLEDLAGESYGVPEAEYRRLIGPFGHSC